MKHLLVFCLSLVLAINASAQITEVGGPQSLKYKGILPVPQKVTMPGFDLAHEKMIDSINDANKAGPWRFGYNHDVDYGLNNSGTWLTFPNGDRVWRLEIKSKYALTMNVIFDQFNLPQGAHVHLYNEDMTHILGAYTAGNNSAAQQLGTELVEGDMVTVEYFEPAAVTGQGQLHIGTVTHGYRKVSIYAGNLMKALNSSGDCNVDILCPLGVGWENQAAAVAMVVVGGNGICTGTLMNNTLEDGTPYFLSANHCGTNAATWAFRFHWASPVPSCATTTPSQNGPTNFQTANGAILRANNSGSDFTLFEISNLPLATAQAWNLYFAGWDNQNVAATQGTGIHHPSGDVMKICREDQALVSDVWNFNGDPNTQIWRVNNWDQGVTEPGSSGSAIFNQNGLVVGQLAGGTAACAGTNDNGGYDGYGKLSTSWNGANASVRLRDWLDPSNSNTTWPGWDPNAPTAPDDAAITAIISPDGAICASSFIPEVTLRNVGTNTLTSVDIVYDIDGGASLTYSWTGNLGSGNSTSVTLPSMTSTAGAHTFNAATNLPNGNTDSNPANDAAANPFYLITNPVNVDFSITVDCWGTEVTWQVVDGATVLYSGGPYADGQPNGGGTSTETWCLQAGACYDFIIDDSYGDGMYGSQYGSCNVDGTYSIDVGPTNLASIIAVNSDYGTQEINNFCVPAGGGPTADFIGSPLSICEGGTVAFQDLSTGSPTSWTWTFPGGTPATSSAQNPTVVYNTPGVYDVTLLVDDGSLTDTKTEIGYITVYANPVVTATGTDETCAGSCDGTATATVAGNPPYTYLWDDPGATTTATATGLCPGTYTCFVTDANGCTGSAVVTINGPTAITVLVSTTDASCFGTCDGMATGTATGGTPPYTYSWSPTGGTNSTATGLCAGTYTLTVTDANGCTGIASGVVNEPTLLIHTGTSTDETACGANDGTITLVATGGTPPYQYSIDNGVTFQASGNFTGLAPGTYVTIVVDANGCTSSLITFVINAGPGFNVTATSTNASCNGACDGTATATATGGTPPYTYSWDDPGSQTTQTATGLCAGTYNVTVTDNNGCTGTASVTVTEPTAVVHTGTSTDETACGANDGTITLAATGGTPPYQYSIDNGVTFQGSGSFTGLAPGTYVTIAQDANGCTSGLFTIVINAGPGFSVSATGTNTLCFGSCDGTATATPSGGTPPYTYSWDDPGTQTTQTATGLCAGVYNVTVTDNNGCTGTAVVTIAEPTALNLTGTSTDETTCGANDGTITLTASGGTPSYTYSIDGGVTFQGSGSFTGLAPGTYITIAQDANGCMSAPFTIVINGGPGFTVSTTVVDATCFGLCDGLATAVPSGGTPPYTYLWDDPLAQTGVTAGNLCPGTYTVTVTDNNGCTGVGTAVINSPTQVIHTGTSTDETACGANDGTIVLTATGGTPPYMYSIDGGVTFQSSPTFTGLAPGAYVTYAQDANGCLSTAFTLVVNAGPGFSVSATSTNASCAGSCDGTATATPSGGTAPYTYSWSPSGGSAATATGLCAGTYTVTVTDNNGCTGTTSVVITEPTPVVVTATSTPATCGLCDGTATAAYTGGTPPYTIVWDDPALQTTQTATGLCAGAYVATVTDANGCVGIYTVIVVDAGAPTVTITNVQNPSCFGVCDGSATATATGGVPPYTYLWGGGQTGSTVTGLCAGVHTVTVTDGNGCTSVATITLVEPPAITAVGSSTDDNCGACDGTATANVTGGTPPYTYMWDDPSSQVTQTAVNLCAGTYTCTITDANGCTQVITVVVNGGGGNITITVTSTDATCAGVCDGTATATATGGTAPYTYLWSGGQTGATVTGLCAGTYTVSVTDATGCSAVATVVINEPTAIVVTAVTMDEMLGNDGSIDATVTGGTPPYTYSWDNGATTEDISGLAAGVYVLTVTDANGCTSITTWTVGSQVGIADLDKENWFLIAPNPTPNFFIVRDTRQQADDVVYTLYDAAGRIVVNGQFVNEIQIDLSTYERGLYLVVLNTGGDTVVRQIIRN